MHLQLTCHGSNSKENLKESEREFESISSVGTLPTGAARSGQGALTGCLVSRDNSTTALPY